MHCIVYGNRCHWESPFPRRTFGRDGSNQPTFDDCIRSLDLPTRLRVPRRGESRLNTELSHNLFPRSRGELGTSVRDYDLGESKRLENPANQQPCCLRGGRVSPTRYGGNPLRELVDDDKAVGVPGKLGFGESRQEVDGDHLPWARGHNGDALSLRHRLPGFGLLADSARAHVLVYVSCQPRLIPFLADRSKRLFFSKVPRRRGVVEKRQQLCS